MCFTAKVTKVTAMLPISFLVVLMIGVNMRTCKITRIVKRGATRATHCNVTDEVLEKRKGLSSIKYK